VIVVEYEGTKFSIMVQIGVRKCFNCGKPGHIGKFCPNKKPRSESKGRKERLSTANSDDGEKRSIYLSTKKRKSLGDGGDSQTDGDISDMDVVVHDNTTTGSQQPFKKPRQSATRKKNNLSFSRSSSKETGNNDPWSYSSWVNCNITKNSVTKSRLKIFLECLRRNGNSKYENLWQQVIITTKDPNHLLDSLFEVMNSISSSNIPVKNRMNTVHKNIKQLLDGDKSVIDNLASGVDLNYRKFEWEHYCRVCNVPQDQQEAAKAHFFFTST
jgi:hypothetical protein